MDLSLVSLDTSLSLWAIGSSWIHHLTGLGFSIQSWQYIDSHLCSTRNTTDYTPDHNRVKPSEPERLSEREKISREFVARDKATFHGRTGDVRLRT